MSGTCSDKKFIAVVSSALFPVDFPCSGRCCRQITLARDLAEWHGSHRTAVSVLSCYRLSLMVIVTRESTSSVGFPSQRPVGVDKFVNCIA